jgi:sulfur-oxidizing protein SoxX
MPIKAWLVFITVWLPLAAQLAVADGLPALPADYCHWEARDYAIQQPLCGLAGNAARGREIVIDTHGGNCLACHVMPIPEEELHGTVGPPLLGLASRMSTAQIRLHIVDQRQFNPATIMPGFYRDPRLDNRVADDFYGKTFLTAQQLEDVVVYLATLQ